MKKFTINATIEITPADLASLVAETFQAAYGDRGSDETPAEHLSRKVEEFVLQIFQNRQAEDQAQASRLQILTEIRDAASIKIRKDKAPEDAENTDAATPAKSRRK